MEQLSNEALQIKVESIMSRIEALERVCDQNITEHKEIGTEINNIKVAATRTDEQYINIMKTLDTLVDKVDKITSRPQKYVEYFIFTIIGGIVMWVINMITKGD
jgi:chromosome segregation ATPase